MDFVQTGGVEAGLPEGRIGELALLIEEIFMNVCSYAYPKGGEHGVVTLTYSIPAPGEISVEVADQGVEFNPLTAPAPDLTLDLESRPIGGLGMVLVKTLAPSVAYRRDHDWNRLAFRMSSGS
jgi:anti-sigma regulatory factor (Ser/Thr protein kinase)